MNRLRNIKKIKKIKKKIRAPRAIDRIEENIIILDGCGCWPKDVIIEMGPGENRKYEFRKTKNGNFQLL